MSFDSTVGGANSNSYIDLAFANSFFERILKPNAWDEASPDEQKRALMTATAWLEEYDYAGSRATTIQSLKFPRFGMDNENGDPELLLGLYDETVIPTPLGYAECELAYYLLTLGSAASAAALTTGTGPISSLKIGKSVEVRYQQQSASATSTTAPTTDSSGLPIHVARYLRGLRLPVVIA